MSTALSTLETRVVAYLSIIKLFRPQKRVCRKRMNGCEALGDKRDGGIFIFIEVQCADKSAVFVRRLDLNLHITLHVSSRCEFGRFVAIRFTFFGCVTCGAGCTDPYYTISGRQNQKN